MIGISGAHSAEFVTEQCAIPAADQLPFGVGLMIWVLETRPELFEATVAAAAQPGVGVLRRSGALGRPAARRGDRGLRRR